MFVFFVILFFFLVPPPLEAVPGDLVYQNIFTHLDRIPDNPRKGQKVEQWKKEVGEEINEIANVIDKAYRSENHGSDSITQKTRDIFKAAADLSLDVVEHFMRERSFSPFFFGPNRSV